MLRLPCNDIATVGCEKLCVVVTHSHVSAARIRTHKVVSQEKKIQPRKTPRQRRSQETVAAILEASARILELDGLSGFNTNAVALCAGVSIGSLYQFFPSKNAILVALIEKYEAVMYVQFREIFNLIHGYSLEHSLQMLIRTMLETHRDRPALHRIPEAAEDRLLGDATWQPLDYRLKDMLVNMLREHRDSVQVRCRPEVVDDLICIVRALINAALERGETRWKRMEKRLMRAVKGYLLISARNAGDTNRQREFA